MSKQATKFSTLKEATDFINERESNQVIYYTLEQHIDHRNKKAHWKVKALILLPFGAAEWRLF